MVIECWIRTCLNLELLTSGVVVGAHILHASSGSGRALAHDGFKETVEDGRR